MALKLKYVMPRFVLLKHDTPAGHSKPTHWDLMLEDGAKLKTWTLWQFPEMGVPCVAIPDADHRIAYLDYEGPVSNDRGFVTRADGGTYVKMETNANRLSFRLEGKLLCGELILDIQSPGSASG